MKKLLKFILKIFIKDYDTLKSIFSEEKDLNDKQIKIKRDRQEMFKELKEWLTLKNFFLSIWEYRYWFLIMTLAFVVGMFLGSIIQYNGCVDYIEENFLPENYWEPNKMNYSIGNSELNERHISTDHVSYKGLLISPPP